MNDRDELGQPRRTGSFESIAPLDRRTVVFAGTAWGIGAALGGCSPPTARRQPSGESPAEIAPAILQFLVVGDSEFGSRLSRAWSAEGRGEANVVHLSEEEWMAQDLAIRPDVDLVVVPSTYLTELSIREALLELPAEIWNGTEINKAELLPHFRTTLNRYGNRIYAAPLGAPQLVLIYRSDVLQALGKSCPDTWDELDALISELAAAHLQNSAGEELPLGFAQPSGDHWLATVLLARLAGELSGHGRLSTLVNVETMRPLLDAPPVSRALERIKNAEASRVSAGGAQALPDPSAVYRELLDGRAALGITWPSAAFANESTAATPFLRAARLPATSHWYDSSQNTWQPHAADDQHNVDYLGFEGLSVAVSQNSLHAPAAFNCLAWLASKRVALQLSVHSRRTGPFRASQLADPLRWVGDGLTPQAAEEYAEVLRATHADRLILTFPRMPGQRRYLQALSKAAQAAVLGTATIPEALQQATAEFNSITESLGGPSKQSRMLRQAEGF